MFRKNLVPQDAINNGSSNSNENCYSNNNKDNKSRGIINDKSYNHRNDNDSDGTTNATNNIIYNDNDRNNKNNDFINSVDNVCANCHQTGIQWTVCIFTRIKKQRMFKLIYDIMHEDDDQYYQLCEQCYEHLICEDIKSTNVSKNCWPAFIWLILSDSNIKHCDPDHHLWKFIPKKWRYWQINLFNYIMNTGVFSVERNELR